MPMPHHNLLAIFLLVGSATATTYHATTNSRGTETGLTEANSRALENILPTLRAGDSVLVYTGTHSLTPTTHILPPNVALRRHGTGSNPVLRVASHGSGAC